jgi:hypothetical protein
MNDEERQIAQEYIESMVASLASKGLIYDTGERQDGQIRWTVVPGKEAEMQAFLAQLESQPHALAKE